MMNTIIFVRNRDWIRWNLPIILKIEQTTILQIWKEKKTIIQKQSDYWTNRNEKFDNIIMKFALFL